MTDEEIIEGYFNHYKDKGPTFVSNYLMQELKISDRSIIARVARRLLHEGLAKECGSKRGVDAFLNDAAENIAHTIGYGEFRRQQTEKAETRLHKDENALKIIEMLSSEPLALREKPSVYKKISKAIPSTVIILAAVATIILLIIEIWPEVTGYLRSLFK